MKELLSLLNRPTLWQRTTIPFWDDEHISEQMLKCHLDPDVEAASRTRSFIDKSIQWLSSVIPNNAHVLDLGCGPGLYTQPLSDMGYDVTGIDFSRRSIEYAKTQDSKTKYIYMNYLNLDYNNQFDAITLIYCDYGALIQSERIELLAKIKRALKPDGIFIFDVFSDKHYTTLTESQSWHLSNGGFWSKDKYLCLKGTYLYDNGISACNYVIMTDNNAKQYIIWDTTFDEDSIIKELNTNGFKVANLYGDVCGSKDVITSKTLCCISKLK